MTLKPIDIIDLRVTRRQARLLFTVAAYRLEFLARVIDPLFDEHYDLQAVHERLESRMGDGLQSHEMQFVELYAATAALQLTLDRDDEEE